MHVNKVNGCFLQWYQNNARRCTLYEFMGHLHSQSNISKEENIFDISFLVFFLRKLRCSTLFALRWFTQWITSLSSFKRTSIILMHSSGSHKNTRRIISFLLLGNSFDVIMICEPIWKTPKKFLKNDSLRCHWWIFRNFPVTFPTPKTKNNIVLIVPLDQLFGISTVSSSINAVKTMPLWG